MKLSDYLESLSTRRNNPTAHMPEQTLVAVRLEDRSVFAVRVGSVLITVAYLPGEVSEVFPLMDAVDWSPVSPAQYL